MLEFILNIAAFLSDNATEKQYEPGFPKSNIIIERSNIDTNIVFI
jgi:hypothetical protein